MSESSVHFLFRLEGAAPDSLTIPTPPVCEDRAAIKDVRQLSLPLETNRDAIRDWRAVEA